MRIYQNIDDFNNKLVNIINFVGIEGKTNIIGSSILKPIHYNSDWDLSTEIKGNLNLRDKIYKRFLKVFKDSKKDKRIFLTDFKCGEDKSGEPLRWSYDDILKGYKIVDNYQYWFTDCLTQKSTIKLDIIYLLNGKFTEMSDNYYIKLGNKTNFDKITKASTIKSLEDDYKELVDEGKYYKALKREFSMIQTNNMNKPTPKNTFTDRQQELISYFNSDIGILNKGKADLEVLLILLEEQNFRKVKLHDIRNNLQIIKQNVSYALDVNLSNKFNKATKAGKVQMIKLIKNIRDNLQNYIDNDAKEQFF